MVKIDKSVVCPELRSKLLAGHELSLRFEQHAQYLKGLLAHFHFCPELAQLPRAQIKRVGTEQCGSCGGRFHSYNRPRSNGLNPEIQPGDCEGNSCGSQEPSPREPCEYT